MEPEKVKQESVKPEPAMKMDFKSEMDDDFYTFQHDLAPNYANIEAKPDKFAIAEKAAVGSKDVASNLQELKQKPKKDDVEQSLARKLTLAQEHVQNVSKELELARTRIDEYKRENLKIRQENKFTLSRALALKNTELAAEKSCNHKLSKENNQLLKTLEKRHSEVAIMSKTNATNCLELETEKSLTKKLTKENKQLKMALERPNSVRWCSSQFQASVMDIQFQGDKDRKEINILKTDVQKMDQENSRLTKLLEKTFSKARRDSEILQMFKVQARKYRKKIDTLEADVEKLGQRIADVTQENLYLRKVLAKANQQDLETMNLNNTIDCKKQKIVDEHCVNQESSEEKGIGDRDRKDMGRNVSPDKKPSPSPNKDLKMSPDNKPSPSPNKELKLSPHKGVGSSLVKELNINQPSAVIHRKKEFLCGKCNQTFKSKAKLKNHAKHHHYKPFLCKICNQTFRVSVAWNNHMNQKHTAKERLQLLGYAEKTYSCYGCLKKFKNASDLRKHDTVNTAETPFTCSKCKMILERECDLWRHELNHIEKKCSSCYLKFTSETALKAHEITHYKAATLTVQIDETKN